MPVAALLLASLLVNPAHGLVLNRIMTFDGPTVPGFQPTVMLGERLFLLDNNSALQVTDGTAAGTRLIFENAVRPRSGQATVVAMNDLVYAFREAQDDVFELWVTDGTQSGTRRAISTQITDPFAMFDLDIVAAQDRLFFPGDNDQLVVTDGTDQGTFFIPAVNPTMRLLCAVNQDQFYFRTTGGEGGNVTNILSQYNNGQVSQISLANLALRLSTGSPSQRLEDVCFYTVRDDNNNELTQLLRIGAEGVPELVEVPLDDAGLFRGLRVEQFQDRLIVSRFRNLDERDKIYELSPNPPFLQEIILNTQALVSDRIGDIDYAGDSVFIHILPPPGAELIFGQIASFDDDFQPTGDAVSINGLQISEVFDFDGVSIISENRSGAFQTLNNDQLELQASLADINLGRFLSSRDAVNEAVYFSGTDNISGTPGLYRLEDEANISERLVGLWGNANLDRQGLQLNTAVSADGQTRFLFMALLTFLGGDTFWLAGASPIVDGADSIDFSISRNTGLNFLSFGEQAANTSVGTARITVLGCNRLRLSLSLDEPLGNHEFEFERLVDQAFARICID